MNEFMKFNTGRPYASNGQVILIALMADESSIYGTSVWFYDTARCVVGKIAEVAKINCDKVLMAYDRGLYEEVSMSDKPIRAMVEHFGLEE